MILAKTMKSKVSKKDRFHIEGELRSIAQRISEIQNECQIYIFGSFLRDDFFTTSDIDLAVIIPDDMKTIDFLDQFYRNKPPTSWPMDLLVFQSSMYEKKKEVGGVCFVIHQEGKSLYPKWSLYDEPLQTKI